MIIINTFIILCIFSLKFFFIYVFAEMLSDKQLNLLLKWFHAAENKLNSLEMAHSQLLYNGHFNYSLFAWICAMCYVCSAYNKRTLLFEKFYTLQNSLSMKLLIFDWLRCVGFIQTVIYHCIKIVYVWQRTYICILTFWSIYYVKNMNIHPLETISDVIVQLKNIFGQHLNCTQIK